MSSSHQQSPGEHVRMDGETAIPEIEADQTIAPRPEEDIADLARATPDVADHSRPPR